jgi:hypothetical protein
VLQPKCLIAACACVCASQDVLVNPSDIASGWW